MKLAFVVDPPSSFKIYKDSTYAMMVEADRRGHELHFLTQDGIFLKGGRVIGASHRLELVKGKDKDAWYRAGQLAKAPLAEFDAVLMRKDPPFDMEYVVSTWLLELAQREGARVFNDPRAIRDHNEKLAIAQFPQFAPPTLVTRLAAEIHEFIAANGDVILKPLGGMGGESVFRVTDADFNRNVVIETLTRHGARAIMAQRYIPEIRDGDKRILVIAGKPVPHCLARLARPGESRANLAAGGTGVARPLSARDREIAEGLGPELARRGLLLVGLDVIGDYVTEVNVTSPTCFQEIAQQTGFDVAGTFMDAVEAAVANEARK
jgi:glutathione synthase